MPDAPLDLVIPKDREVPVMETKVKRRRKRRRMVDGVLIDNAVANTVGDNVASLKSIPLEENDSLLSDAKSIGENCNCKRFKCFETTTADQRLFVFQQFRKLASRKMQDVYLADLISMEEVKQRKSKSNRENSDEEDSSRKFEHSAAYYYRLKVPRNVMAISPDSCDPFLDLDYYEVPVCRSAFLGVLGVSRGRLRSIQLMLFQEHKRGNSKAGGDAKVWDRKMAKRQGTEITFPSELAYLIEVHIDDYHLSETYSVKEMHNSFLNEYQINIPYNYYWYFFHATFNIAKFRPQITTCPTFDTFAEILQMFDSNGGSCVPSLLAY